MSWSVEQVRAWEEAERARRAAADAEVRRQADEMWRAEREAYERAQAEQQVELRARLARYVPSSRERDRAIYEAHLAGEQHREIAERYCISAARVSQICRALTEADCKAQWVRPWLGRNLAIYKARCAGEALRSIGERHGLSGEQVRRICVQVERKAALNRARWRPTVSGGHPGFVDPYGVDICATPRDVFLDDRFLVGKEIGA
jgi:hypothetical protein